MVLVANKTLITKANKIIQLVLAVDYSCADLCARAQLLHKLGNDPKTTRTAQEAVVLATKDKTYTEGATELLVGISPKKMAQVIPTPPKVVPRLQRGRAAGRAACRRPQFPSAAVGALRRARR